MRIARTAAVVSLFASVLVACGLNPQPLPPDNPNDAGAAGTTTKGAADSGTTGLNGSGGGSADAEADGSLSTPTGSIDGGLGDAGDVPGTEGGASAAAPDGGSVDGQVGDAPAVDAGVPDGEPADAADAGPGVDDAGTDAAI